MTASLKKLYANEDIDQVWQNNRVVQVVHIIKLSRLLPISLVDEMSFGTRCELHQRYRNYFIIHHHLRLVLFYNLIAYSYWAKLCELYEYATRMRVTVWAYMDIYILKSWWSTQKNSTRLKYCNKLIRCSIVSTILVQITWHDIRGHEWHI